MLFSYSAIFLRKIGIYDVAGVFNLHGIPGMIGGLISAIFRQAYIDNRGGVQVAGTFISIGIGLFGGLIVGVCIKSLGHYQFENEFFNDTETVDLEEEVKEKLSHYGEVSKKPDVLMTSVRDEFKTLNTEPRTFTIEAEK